MCAVAANRPVGFGHAPRFCCSAEDKFARSGMASSWLKIRSLTASLTTVLMTQTRMQGVSP